MKKMLLILALTTMGLVAGCASDAGSVAPPQDDKKGAAVMEQRWNLLLLGTSERWRGNGETPWIEIDSDGRLSGSNGCNRLMGEVSFPEGQRIEITRLASTRMACPNPQNSQRVNQLLENAYRYLIDHDRLVLLGPNGRVLGGFRRGK
ncbi:META domain-containing protein [Pistricoccus aurantiacus]|uniref:META domain-containing protein n=1 Tax=Pistricoccus aurantiacus TaxID=1883414 RepID=A0A5B8SRW7_9GAMM|nr:META domain-containing protein [Pistricoccus aurantiacus]QEA37833.1 META domain-containing protein [Pistricoccus aurantiacus]